MRAPVLAQIAGYASPQLTSQLQHGHIEAPLLRTLAAFAVPERELLGLIGNGNASPWSKVCVVCCHRCRAAQRFGHLELFFVHNVTQAGVISENDDGRR